MMEFVKLETGELVTVVVLAVAVVAVALVGRRAQRSASSTGDAQPDVQAPDVAMKRRSR